MIELLAAIEPASLPLLAVLVFSASLYPLGLMLGSGCSPCCDIPCAECEAGKLPDTVTVTFDGFPDTAQGPFLVFVTFTSCSGLGAAARLTLPNAVSGGPGPMEMIEVFNQGGGYAVVGREEPTVAVAPAGNEDATFAVVLSLDADACLPYWAVSSITVTAGGTGYQYGQTVQLIADGGATAEQTGFARIITITEEPTVTLVASPGEAAILTPTWQVFDADKYRLDAVTVEAGGTGYVDGTPLTISPTETTTQEAAAYAEIRTTRLEPTLTLTTGITSNASGAVFSPALTEVDSPFYGKYWTITNVLVTAGGSGFVAGEGIVVQSGPHTEQWPFQGAAVVRNDQPTLSVVPLADSGTGAELSATLAEVVLPDGSAAWEIAEIAVVNGGSGYAPGGAVEVTLTAGSEIAALEATLDVDEAGVITGVVIADPGRYAIVGVLDSVTIFTGGEYFLDDGVIASVEVFFGGVYYNDTGVVARVDVTAGGRYYLENTSLPAIVPAITLQIMQSPGSNGTGAVLTPVVDTDHESATFGHITGVTITEPGDNYLAWAQVQSYCMGDYFNGRPIVLARRKFWGAAFNTSEFACDYYSVTCDPLSPSAWSGGQVVFSYGGDEGPSTVVAQHVSLSTEATISDCGDFQLEFPADSAVFAGQQPAFDNVTATVTSGGGSVEEALSLRVTGTDEQRVFVENGVCGACCLNEQPVPSEIIVAIENITHDPVTSLIPDGDYVFSRNANLDAFYDQGWSSPINWWAVTGAGLAVVSIHPCATLSGTTADPFWARGQCDDTCFKKCRLFILFFNVPPGYDALYSPECDCDDFPICSPPPGTYALLGGVPAPGEPTPTRFLATIV